MSITDEELARGMHDFARDQGWHFTQAPWIDLSDGHKFSITNMAIAARRLLAPTYRDEDVERLVEAARYLIDEDEVTPLGNPTAYTKLTTALDPFAPSTPTPEQQRLERGKAAYEANARPGEALWDDFTSASHEYWCKVADDVLAKKAEQDGETGA